LNILELLAINNAYDYRVQVKNVLEDDKVKIQEKRIVEEVQKK
ncbi:43724_t:CDS:1, partial [Gigaspora margarita]